MKIETFTLGMLQTNCYLVENEETKELVIIDPAVCTNTLIQHIKQSGYQPKAILLTHGHFDHVMGINALVDAFGISVYLHEKEQQLLGSPELNLSYTRESYSYKQGIGLKDGTLLEVAGFRIQIIHTPGHTAGGCCYYLAEDEVLISGDTLFCQSVGRTDFPTSSTRELVTSIREKLFCLPDTVMVYPGHGCATCIGDEKQYNPYV